MRQKPLQWLSRRLLAGGQHLGTKGFSSSTSRVSNASSVSSFVWRWSSGLDFVPPAKLPWDFATTRVYAAPVMASPPNPKNPDRKINRAIPSSFVRRWSSGLDFVSPVKVPWDFATTRAYAAPVKATPPNPKNPDRKINRAIVARMVRLVGDEGHEVLSRYDALNRAQQAGLDLVEVDGKADPPVCKLMDFSKERFKVKKQEKDLRKKHLERRRLDDLKEVRFSSRTEQKDLEMKAETVSRLLARGHRVKLAVQFHGNDKGDEVGVDLLQRAMGLLQSEVKVENGPRVEKMRAWVMIRPVSEQKTTVKRKNASKIVTHETVANESSLVEV